MSGFFVIAMLMAAPAQFDDLECPGYTTIEINQCAAADVAQSRERMERYLDAARKRQISDERPELVPLIDASQASFEAYAENECNAVYQNWIEGTIRTIMALGCHQMLIHQRTHVIWQNWLTFGDSTPALLPEPGLTAEDDRPE